MKKRAILSINRSDNRGGAAVVAWNLFDYFRRAGMDSYYAVQQKNSDHPNVLVIPDKQYAPAWRKLIDSIKESLQKRATRIKGLWTIATLLDWVGSPARVLRRKLGYEEFNYAGSRHVLDLVPHPIDIVQLHVLHGGYFDLRYLASLSARMPVFCTLHDAWMLSGHCAHSFDCTRWETGCGKCPDLTIPVAIERDGSATNWKRKHAIYQHSRLYIATPCQWLMDKVSRSMLARAAVETRVIPNGVDPSVFHPGDKLRCRDLLGLPQGAYIFLFAANGIRRNRWKDFEMMKAAIARIASLHQSLPVIFLALGEAAPTEIIGNTEIRFMPFRTDPAQVANFYRAADLYLHAAKAETFPTTILESLSCGTPVIATAVGGIPEQVRGYNGFGNAAGLNQFDAFGATGILTAAGDNASFAEAIILLMENEPLRMHLGKNASADAAERFTLQKQGESYLKWYEEVAAKLNKGS